MTTRPIVPRPVPIAATGLALALLTVGCVDSGTAGTDATGASLEGPRATEEGHFRLTVLPELDPIPINRIHTWTVEVTDPDGRPVEGARVVIDGDMPEHQHGLPTVPRMTGETAPGTYRVEGMKFSMPGYWVVIVHVWSEGVTDRATLELTLG